MKLVNNSTTRFVWHVLDFCRYEWRLSGCDVVFLTSVA